MLPPPPRPTHPAPPPVEPQTQGLHSRRHSYHSIQPPYLAVPTLSSAHFGISHPDLDAEFAASASRQKHHQRRKSGNLDKRYESRDHILAKAVIAFIYIQQFEVDPLQQHKARVQEEWQKDKQEMIDTLYEMRQKAGTCKLVPCE